MIKSISSIAILILLLISCQTESTESKSESSELTPKKLEKENKAESSTTKGLSGVSACDLISASTLSGVLPSEAGYNKEESADDEGKRVACKYGLKEGFGLLNWAVNYNEKGWGNNDSRFGKIDSYEKVEIDGTDGAYFNAIQHKLEAWKGDYSLTLMGPVTQAGISNSERIKKDCMAVAEEIFSNL